MIQRSLVSLLFSFVALVIGSCAPGEREQVWTFHSVQPLPGHTGFLFTHIDGEVTRRRQNPWHEDVHHHRRVWRLGRYDLKTGRVEILDQVDGRNRGEGGSYYSCGRVIGDFVLIHRQQASAGPLETKLLDLRSLETRPIDAARELEEQGFAAGETPRLLNRQGWLYTCVTVPAPLKKEAQRGLEDGAVSSVVKVLTRSPEGRWRVVAKSPFNPTRGYDEKLYIYDEALQQHVAVDAKGLKQPLGRNRSIQDVRRYPYSVSIGRGHERPHDRVVINSQDTEGHTQREIRIDAKQMNAADRIALKAR